MKRLLITGGAGFIGSNFIRRILKNYDDVQVVNLDKLTYCGNLENLKDVENNKNYKFVKGDIADSKVVNRLVKNCDIIVNFAAESITGGICLPVWTTLGIRIYSFEELFRNISRRNKVSIHKNSVEIVNVRNKNIKALAYKGGIGYWMPIRQISRHRYKGKITRLHQKWGEIEATPNHSIYDIDFQISSPESNPELLALRNINYVGKSQYGSYKGKRLTAIIPILGAYVSEGWSSFNKNNGSYQVGIANKNKKWIDSLKDDLKVLGYNPSITKTKGAVYQLVVANKELFNFVRREAGYSSRGKKIPDFIFNLKKIYQKEFLKNIMLGDGEVIENKDYKTMRYTTTSRKLATGLSLFLTMLKYNYSVARDRRFNAYTLIFGGDYTISLLDKNHEKVNYDGYVYDISVEGLNNFVCGVGNIVVHNTHVDRSIMDPSSFVRTNVFGTYTLLEEARKSGVKLLIQASTDEVYGSILDGAFKETDPLMPNSPYSASKASSDLLARSYFVTYNMPVIITRSSNNFGPYQYPEKVIPLFITNALEGRKVPLYADGMNVRDWLFVSDNCEAIDVVMRKGKAGEIYNIGAGSEITNLELTHAILDLLGKEKSLIEFVKDRPGHDKRYALDITKIKKLGWRPEHDFRSAIKLTIDWYKDNKRWWKKLVEC